MTTTKTARTQAVKVYCHMHDVLFNSNERKMEQASEAKIACPCCDRYVSTLTSQAFTLPEAQDNPGAPACNCFFFFENGSHTKEAKEHYLRGKTHAEHVKDSEENERDFNGSSNANGCRIHGDCDVADCKGST